MFSPLCLSLTQHRSIVHWSHSDFNSQYPEFSFYFFFCSRSVQPNRKKASRMQMKERKSERTNVHIQSCRIVSFQAFPSLSLSLSLSLFIPKILSQKAAGLFHWQSVYILFQKPSQTLITMKTFIFFLSFFSLL